MPSKQAPSFADGDYQAGRVYMSQQEILYPGMTWEQAIAQTPDFTTPEQATAYAKDVQSKVGTLWPKFAKVPLRVRWDRPSDGLTLRTAGATVPTYPFEMMLTNSGWGRSKDTVLHELAHVVTLAEDMADRHGPNFAKVLLILTKNFGKAGVYQKLANRFSADGVDIAA